MKLFRSKSKRRFLIATALLAILTFAFAFSLPRRLFEDPYSTVLMAKDGELLCATIASDGQWRFPETKSVPEKFSEALIAFEDKRFYSHLGVDPLSLARAVRQNISDRRIVSGGSTVTMQVVRLSRKGRDRTIFQKIIEMILAVRLEMRHSKEEILAIYASHAPFGGNVVGLDAACWRYFGRTPDQLSWGEASLLAVLPNAPSLMHPGKNREKLRVKRDRLLDRLIELGKIDETTAALAKEEKIPEEPQALPQYARHLLTRAAGDGRAQHVITSTVDYSLQVQAEFIIRNHNTRLAANQVHNAAAIVLDVATGKVLAYVGNTGSNNPENHVDVDVIRSSRSTGSILKPFLFAAMLDEGKMLPKTLFPDVPTLINGFSPQNFSMQYDGAVPANKALIRSLNIPAVHMLKAYR